MRVNDWMRNGRLMGRLRRLGDIVLGNGPLAVVRNANEASIADVESRLRFYLGDDGLKKVDIRRTIPMTSFFTSAPVLSFGIERRTLAKWQARRENVYDLDFQENPHDGDVWFDLLRREHSRFSTLDLTDIRNRFTRAVEEWRREELQTAYVFGTGPSLARAIDRDWSDGYRIVCNTIVRDAVLWNHIKPHAIVAGDAIYHFGHTMFATKFRRDLAARLEETATLFVYPSVFHPIVQREFSEYAERLIPVPVGRSKHVHGDLTVEFVLPALGNVLNLLLLPVSCTLAKQIGLFGFDGRAPTDQLFWGNSEKHTYLEEMQELRKAHPAFFRYHVPEDEPERYVRSVHGEELENALAAAEADGWRFVMLHDSWTDTLQRRRSETVS